MRAKRNWKGWVLSIGSAAASAGVLYLLLPAWAGGMLLLVVSAHEFGHVFMARWLGVDASPPIFIPLGILVIGATRIKNSDPEVGQFIAIAGPLAGAACAFALMLFSAIAGSIPAILTALWFLAWEVWNITVGDDGRKFRRYRAHSDSGYAVA